MAEPETDWNKEKRNKHKRYQSHLEINCSIMGGTFSFFFSSWSSSSIFTSFSRLTFVSLDLGEVLLKRKENIKLIMMNSSFPPFILLLSQQVLVPTCKNWHTGYLDFLFLSLTPLWLSRSLRLLSLSFSLSLSLSFCRRSLESQNRKSLN